jgi:HD-GYP domain-containing protein (c-di-GMP phosphodiesterase class II)
VKKHSPARRRLIFLSAMVPVFGVAALAIVRPEAFARLDHTVYDVMVRSAGTSPPSDRITIVDIDERSLSTVGQWPWRRDLVAALIERLRSGGAAVIALDMMFSEPDRYAPARADADRTAPTDTDLVLARTLEGGGVILGYGLTFDAPGDRPSSCILDPIGIVLLEPPGETGTTPFFTATDAVCNLPILSQAAGASGFMNAAPDADGILRRVPLVARLGGRMYPSLAVAAVSKVTGVRDMALHVTTVNDAVLRMDDVNVPLDARSGLLLRFRGKKRTFRYLSAADVMSGRMAVDAVRDKMVFVGTNALGTREVVATPLDTLFAGVEVQATVADNLLRGDFISRSAAMRVAEVAAVLLVGVAVALMFASTGVVAGLLAGAVGATGLWVGCVWQLGSAGIFVSPLFGIVAVAAELSVMTLMNFRFERKRADRVGRERTAARKLLVESLLSLTEVRDAETGRHSLRTQRLARILAEQLATHPEFRPYLTRERIDLLATLAPIHDIGKVGIRDQVLNKPGALTPEELAEMRQHPTLGREVILKAEQRVGVRDDETLEMAKDIVYTHHERWDGTGYPQGLKGPQIPIVGRIMAVVDVYDAVHTRTLYSAPLSSGGAEQMIVKGRGSHFDPTVVDAFQAVAPVFRQVSDESHDDGPAEAGHFVA